MAVASGARAVDAVRALIGTTTVPASTLLADPYLPPGFGTEAGVDHLDPDSPVGGYGDEARYALGSGDPAVRLKLVDTPASALGRHPRISDPLVQKYVQSSLDLTMQGGTTSGVVYPLAICELATQFRFRNVGGASAGAIAAAITAAAEVGRSEQVRAAETLRQAQGTEGQTEALRQAQGTGNQTEALRQAQGAGGLRQGTEVRAGFVGVTDVIGWLTQTRPGDAQTEEFRLAQLFRPGARTAGVYRVLVALMRQRGSSLPLVIWAAVDWLARLAVLAVVLAGALGTGLVAARLAGSDRSWWSSWGWGALGLVGFAATGVALVLLVQGAFSFRRPRRDDRAPDWLRQLRRYVSTAPRRPVAVLRDLLGPGLVVAAAVVVFGWWRPVAYVAGLVGGLLTAALTTAVLLAWLVRFVSHLGDRGYGLLSGSTPPRPRSLLDLLAGVPRPTTGPSVVAWLHETLSSLAGLPPGEVLRFGHLWSGVDYSAARLAPTTTLLDQWRQAADDQDERLVNLQLMTTDLTRHRPFRFPLPPCALDDPDQLWLCLDDLVDGDAPMFPAEVVTALRSPTPRQILTSDGQHREIHPLPLPWELPVVFAVRISMALPVLFRAVRLYRIRPEEPVQDDFGRTLTDDGRAVRTPPRVEEVWFSDGGITSNFPIHFFDNPLPRWPTVSLNLDRHPELAPHQDVWLPQDWDDLSIPVVPLTRSGLSFGAAIFTTTRTWRDSLQSALPGYRHRIAQVRTAPSEGGTNLFMPREVVASLALRGALAGARLRARFGDDRQWNRFRWLRLRTAMSNYEEVRVSLDGRRGFYADALASPDWLRALEARYGPAPDIGSVPWYEPESGFWPGAADLLRGYAEGYSPPDGQTDALRQGRPVPEPALRQVPRE